MRQTQANKSAPVGQNQLPLEFSGQNQQSVGQNQLQSDFSGQNVLPKPVCLPSSQFPPVGILSQNTSCVIMAHTPTGFTSQNVSQFLRYDPAIPVNNHGNLVNVQGVAVNTHGFLVNSREDNMDNSVPFGYPNMTQNENSPSLNSNHYNNIFTEAGSTYQNL